MKYDLTIRDLDADQLSKLVNQLNGDVQITTAKPDVVVPFAAVHTETANQNVTASQATTNDVDALLNASTNNLLQAGKTDERDVEGMTWDERIHSGSKKRNTDGRWKLRKGVEDSLVASVKAEVLGKASPVMTAPVATVGQEPPAFLRRDLPPVVQSVTAPPIVPATLAVNATVPPAAVQPTKPARDFSGLMLQISNLFAKKLITPEYPKTVVDRINAGFGSKIATLTDIANDPRMVEYGWQCLEVDGKAA